MNDNIVVRNGMTQDELTLAQLMADAWNLFCKLPVQHPSDIAEAQTAIHDFQKLLALRTVRRDYPEIWITPCCEEA